MQNWGVYKETGSECRLNLKWPFKALMLILKFIKRSIDQFCLPGSKKGDIPFIASYLEKCDIPTMLCGQTNLHIPSIIFFWVTLLRF